MMFFSLIHGDINCQQLFSECDTASQTQKTLNDIKMLELLTDCLESTTGSVALAVKLALYIFFNICNTGTEHLI